MKIGIIIPCINLWSKYTKPCIDSIKTKHDYKITLIDNASTDETKDEASKMVSEKFSYVHNHIPFGCASSWNQGTLDAFASGMDYILVLNNDVLLHPLAIDEMVNRFEKAHRNNENIAMITCQDFRDVFSPETIMEAKIAENPQEFEHPNFSAFMIDKNCWNKVGVFDEGFRPAYFEDNDYHRRILLAGLKAICISNAMFYHFGSRTQNEAIPGQVIVSSPAFEKNRGYYIAKWGGIPGYETFAKPFNEV